MKFKILIISFLLTALVVFANGEMETPITTRAVIANVNGGILKQVDLTDDKAKNIIDSINIYNLESRLISRMEDIIKEYNEKIYFECHIGMLYSFLDNFYEYNTTDDNDEELIYDIKVTPEFMFKFNLNNPKIYNYKQLLDEIILIKGIVAYYKIDSPIQLLNRLDNIENELKEYDEELFFKRISFGLGLPVNFHSFGSSESLFEKTNFFIGYDIKDIATVNVGYNIFTFDDFYIGLSIDVSSPVIYSTTKFYSTLEHVLDIPTY